jgi:DNA (cytosine-5)-methyltransferase 1
MGRNQPGIEPEDALLIPPDLSGWPPHPSERRDFCNRIRAFPPEVAAWRKRLLKNVCGDPDRFPLVNSSSPSEIQSRLDEGVTFLREVARILASLYGTPNLGNKPDPIVSGGDRIVHFGGPVWVGPLLVTDGQG